MPIDPTAPPVDPSLDREVSEAGGPARTMARNAFRLLVGLIVAASFGVWIYAYSGFADRPPPDLLIDTELAVRAEAICAAAVADVEAMPGAGEATDEFDRASQVRRSTARFEAMVSDLERLEVVEADDRVIMEGWLADWRTLLGDRLRYAEAVIDDPTAPFLLTDVANERLDRRLTRVADTNLMSSCGTPTDAG